MIIPISHEETTVRRLPWVTFGIMAVCTAVLILSELRGDAENLRAAGGSSRSSAPSTGSFTYMFMHAGWGHLSGTS